MKSGICPKCGSHEVYSGENVSFKSGTYGSNSIPLSFWSYAPLDNYVCTECGYVESYIGDPKKLEHIQQKWVRVKKKRDLNDDDSI